MPGDAMRFFDAIQDEERLKEFRQGLKKFMRLCKDHYLKVMGDAERRAADPATACPDWSLNRFKEVDRKGWEPKPKYSYPLFFVDRATYEQRIKNILTQVAGSARRRGRQADEARVSYRSAEVYVDWSEALVRDASTNHDLIETIFVVAFASWFALILMNKNSSLFLLEAFDGMVTGKPRSTANAVHQRNMAYKDVSDAALPIRWTTRRRDLFMLETIHRNWSSERWRKNIEERMKLLALHYKHLEDERGERTNRNLALAAAFLALFTLASAIADVINLAENDNQPSHWLIWGHPLKQIDLYLSLLPVLVGLLIAVSSWLTSILRPAGNNNR